MGLPIFITPVDPEIAPKSPEKATSGPRSSIRRQRTIRGSHSRHSIDSRRRRMLDMLADNAPEDIEPAMRGSMPPPLSRDMRQSPGMLPTASQRDQQERMRLRDTLSFERQHPPRSEIDGPFMPPVPESRDYSGTEERQRDILRLRAMRQDLRRLARRRPAPTPPYTDIDLSVSNTHANRRRTWVDSPRASSLTPARSPSHQVSSRGADVSSRPPVEESDFTFTSFERPGRSDLSERVRTLNRVSNQMEQSRRTLRQARLDGLGDRDRSLSPENGAAWDTLLTSITPDPQPPSAGSSFASTSAAAAASSASGPASASTSMTSIDRGADSPTLRDCDIISDFGTNSDEEEEDIYELQDISRSRGDRFWRTYADVVTSRDLAARSAGHDTEHLGGMHRIISRLASRDEIPEEWWASAGLSRNLRREPLA